ncbi:G-rich sequence factor 1 isoform X1 [Ambystoma mexicanum]|uniref:G-rich sequence factor 1 isoform X1 n=1 Tax=Ambystoma mexicanum TaxID=8296 RepID=UPI0037E8D8AF
MSSSCRVLGTRLLLQLLQSQGKASARRGYCKWTHVDCKPGDYPPLSEYQKSPPLVEAMAVVKVRGLPWTCTVDDLIVFFHDCKIRNREEGVHLPLNREGKPRGDAVIEFESEDDLQKAMEKHKKYMGQRYIEVFKVNPQDASLLLNRLQPASSHTVEEGVVRLRGLPYSCTEEDIAQFFTGLSIAEDGITFVLDHRGKKSGDAFVQFMTSEMAEQALLKHRAEMGNRYIEIFKSRRSEIQTLRFPYKKRRQDSVFTPTSKEDAVEPAIIDAEPAQELDSFSDHLQEYLKEMTEKPLDVPEYDNTSYVPTIHMRGLPFQASAEDIANFFHPLMPLRITMYYNSFEKSTGEAMVQFATQEDAVCGMVKNRSLIQKNYIELFLSACPKGQ